MGERDAELGRLLDTALKGADEADAALDALAELLFCDDGSDREVAWRRVVNLQGRLESLKHQVRELTRLLQPHREGA